VSFSDNNDNLVNNGETSREMFNVDCNHEFINFSREGGRISSEAMTNCDMSSHINPHALFKTTYHYNYKTQVREAHMDKDSYLCNNCHFMACKDCFTQCNLNANFK
jgi:hypothetical protein